MENVWRYDNELLLARIHKHLGTSKNRSIAAFGSTPASWRCPVCYRAKDEFARVKDGELLCSIHWHHDHLRDRFNQQAKVRLDRHRKMAWAAARIGLVRFSEVQVCNDCNVVEAEAKRQAKINAVFSFSSIEIASFITVRKNADHTIDVDAVRRLWEVIEPQVQYLAAVFNEVDDLMMGKLTEPSRFGIVQALAESLDEGKNERGKPEA